VLGLAGFFAPNGWRCLVSPLSPLRDSHLPDMRIAAIPVVDQVRDLAVAEPGLVQLALK
jgi:hypothetical protein